MGKKVGPMKLEGAQEADRLVEDVREGMGDFLKMHFVLNFISH